MPRIDGKTVWITGASSGIGEELAYQLSLRNCKLILSARRKEMLEKVKDKCANKENIYILPLDIIEFEKMNDKVEKALSIVGNIDVLVNNAGISQRSLIAETDFSVYQKMIDVDYLGTVALTKALLPHFIKQKSGHFVTVSSLMGKFSSPYRSGYCGAKHALHGFFDSLRMEHDKDNIDVTMVCPGFVNTNIAKSALTGDGSQQGENDQATENGITTEKLCSRMVKAIERKNFEIYVGGKETKGVYVKRFFPKLLHKLVLRSTVK
ncbi:SDR family NAD(P)-dependent oxidoreductase [Croceitalea sp. MTPC9]|uniref:SDR family oxidoreductase n=1 Tax=unclassified Croceitalea TaxID=2632280 RepID=UPI002B3C7E4B|nr:SDR family NAD(P)-dependent oxidoreductase [Croceitalea sp. MTPC6]GMN15892.1 SDR family NAD(P)-dependent oxidoreductase [Croceitalea sp. MTPC9]